MAKGGSSKKARVPRRPGASPKQAALDQFRVSADGAHLTTDQGLRINDDQNSLKAGDRGPSLLEDFILREKITHFDHERIPERVVHARGAGARPTQWTYRLSGPTDSVDRPTQWKRAR